MDVGQGMYVMGLGNGYILDGEDPSKSTFLRYINHSRRRANCRAEEVVDTDFSGPFAAVAVVAERDIAPGEELMFDCAGRPRTWHVACAEHTHVRAHARKHARARKHTNACLARPPADGEEYWDELGVPRFSLQRLLIDYG